MHGVRLRLSNALIRLSPADWERTVTHTYPEPAERSLRWVAAHTLHELRHHLLDIRQQLDRTDEADSRRASR
ncbi:MAG TPA: DinB family protein [Mycobacterium sp.]|nr:DinB family protein [Mycobacterium sp.]HUH71615.1 DinB family protein [Mycobacterium sp.]